jgi:Domain of unknown function (DUF4158)
MPNLIILSEQEQHHFDYPPSLSGELRSICFAINPDLGSKLQRLRTSTNKVGFLLQYAYFKAYQRFFVANKYRQEDVEYAAKLLGILPGTVHLLQYKKKLPSDHQQDILSLLEYRPFDEKINQWLEREIQQRVERFTEPRRLFFELLQLLRNQRVEIPSYHRLAELISQAYINYENAFSRILQDHLRPDLQA